jgi:hypothetical protein
MTQHLRAKVPWPQSASPVALLQHKLDPLLDKVDQLGKHLLPYVTTDDANEFFMILFTVHTLHFIHAGDCPYNTPATYAKSSITTQLETQCLVTNRRDNSMNLKAEVVALNHGLSEMLVHLVVVISI